MKSLFLQDADSLVHKTDELIEIIEYARKRFPTIERITSYSRSRTIAKKTLDDLKKLKDAGLSRIHIGMESGADSVLSLINKGATAEEHIHAGKMVMEAGFELSEYVMPGLGGEQYMNDHAIESALVLNEINPTFIRLRSTIPVPGTPLFEMMKEGTWSHVSETDKIKEIQVFITALENIESVIESDHIMNLIEDIEGKMPEKKEYILSVIDSFFSMDQEDRDCFIIGRRTGSLRYLIDYKRTVRLQNMRKHILQNYSSVDEAMLQILTNYI